MRFRFLFVILVFTISFGFSQNVGQKGDTLLNYVDINGLKQGNWKKNHENGKLKFEAYFIDDRPVGDLKRYDTRGNLYAHLNYDEKGVYASAIFFHKNGKTAGTGKYFEQTKDSVWKFYSDQGNFFLQESYKKGIKHGTFKNITAEGITIEEKNYKDGILHGAWKKYYVDGTLMWESTYVEGKLEGKAKSYFQNGKIYREGAFKNDLMEGGWLIYKESGGLDKVYQYKNGVCPKAQKDLDEFTKKLMEGKGQYDGPQNSNDVEWLRTPAR